ncbi:alpha/beta hydrolase [Aspergillus thermomutatus]|uniref:Alpha/beta hydrolase fold-3 domain-containing protein n=1 Tax=Aspergillus thermomutatus TaxID=41047 RepID=A0A397H7T5_ASPTH|nr:uncharacterized protein CDV56_104889 [Aspergillus thermomutatus]RHZ57473.1 hypothetical protein CDV56_104889 [Aspergillus thermomutatus]
MAALDPVNQSFIDASSGAPPLYTKSYQEARQVLETIQKHQPASDIDHIEKKVPFGTGNVTTIIFRPKAARGPLPVIFYTHGGGWVLGSPNAHGSLMEDLARQTNAAVVFPYYTPAPEKQYPTQFEESYAVSSGPVGGHMAIAMVQLVHQRQLPIHISHLVLFYPVTDTHKKTETYKTFQNGPYLTEKTMDWMIDAFLPDPEDRKNALTSPLSFAKDEDLAKFPPTTLFVSGADPLIGEGEAFGLRLQKAGVETTVLKADGQIHDYVMLEPVRKSATAKAVVELAATKIKNAIAK